MERLSKLKAYFVFLEVGLEVYENSVDVQPAKQFFYKSLEKMGFHEGGVYWVVGSSVYWLLFDKAKEQHMAVLDYFTYLLETNKTQKTPHVPIDLGEHFEDLRLQTLVPYYSFNKAQFTLEEEERKRKEQERKDRGEDEEV